MYIGYPKARLYLYGLNSIELPKKLDFFVTSGSKLESVSNQLLNKNVINDTVLFRKYCLARNLKDATIEPGKYVLVDGMSISDLVVNFRKGYGEKEVEVTFNNARTIDELAQKVTSNLEMNDSTLILKLKNPKLARQYGFDTITFFSMFIPNTYRFYWDVPVEELIAKMAREYKLFWNSERQSKANALGLSQSEVSILASIVKSETTKKDEAPIIAGVYINRLKKGMKLDADPTLVWALGDFTIKRVLNKHKKINSPYNTYMYAGLPPGPIYLPSKFYIDAVLNYQKHDFLFFCAKEDFSGYSNFAESYRQHLINARKYQRALNDRNIYR